MRKINWTTTFNFGSYDDRAMLDTCQEFTYGHFKVGPGHATVAGGRIDNKLYYGITFCSPQDNFSKKIGRARACQNLREDEHSHMRGVLELEGNADDAQPAMVLKMAVEYHLQKMRNRRPQWSKEATVDFRGKRRNFGEVTDYELFHR